MRDAGSDKPRVSPALAYFFNALVAAGCLVVAEVDAETAGQIDYSEYDAILSLDDAQLSQLADGWHGGATIDNALPDTDGDAAVAADLRHQTLGHEFASRLRVVDSDIYQARLQYSQQFLATGATRWHGVVSAGYDNDALANRQYSADFEDHDSEAALALAVEHDFDALFVRSQWQARWRRFERRGEGVVLQQPATLDVEKDFRALAWNLAAQWRLGNAEQSLWLQATRVTDMDVSVCVDEICLAADKAEQDFSLYDVMFDQQWYLTADYREGISLVTQLAGYTASVDHLPVNYQFSIGGMHSVRGYDEAIAGGDEMALWRNELRLPWNTASGFVDAGARQHAYLFYDWGMVWQHAVDTVINDRRFELLPETSTRLSAAGVGIDLVLAGDFSLRLEYARVLAAIDGVVDAGDTRVHASLDWRAF